MNIIKINEFEGPLDLLLHLIKKSELDIWEISLTDITNQYVDYIKQMEELNLTVASEYLVMAAELLELKSRMLLPKPKLEEDDTPEEDPREALIKRLLEYKKYKDMTEDFKALEEKRKGIFTKLPNDLKQYSDETIIATLDDNNSPMILWEAFKSFLERKKQEMPLPTKITKNEISVESRIKYISNIVKEKGKVKFEELFEVINKEYVITTFLAVLELVKDKVLTVTQENNFHDIYVVRKMDDE